MIRPLRHRLSDEAVTLMDEQRAAGQTPLPVHMMLVEETAAGERGRVACGEGLGEWVTGDVDQVTCQPCLESKAARVYWGCDPVAGQRCADCQCVAPPGGPRP